jgi:CRISPR-associated protein Cas5d
MKKHSTPKNSISFLLRGRNALFTDPVSRIGGEKCSYHIPTYEALKGVAESIYWKPTFHWVIDQVRVLNPIRTESKNVKPLKYGGGNDLSTYTYLADLSYQVIAHFEWNLFRDDLEHDRSDAKHHQVAQRMLKKGGRRDIFLGTRECQGYVEPENFGTNEGHYDKQGELAFGLMFHGFDYPDATGKHELHARFWRPVMKDGVIHFIRPDSVESGLMTRKFIREMAPRRPQTSGLKEKGLLE